MSEPISFERLVAAKKEARPQKRLWLSTGTPGIDLAYEIHMPKQPFKDLLVFYHGGGAHGRAGYDCMARALSDAAPVAVCLPDVRGHGSSSGPRGHAFPSKVVWDDVDLMVAAMRRLYPGVRIHLGGHSSGSGMLLNHLTRRQPRETADSLILLAPEFGWRAGLYQCDNSFGSFTRVRRWPFLLAACTGGLLGSSLPAVYFQLPEDAKKFGCLPAYSVGMANAVTPAAPAWQLRQLALPTHIAVANDDQLINANRLAAFIECNGGNNVHVARLNDVDHLGVILDSVPFLSKALGYLPSH